MRPCWQRSEGELLVLIATRGRLPWQFGGDRDLPGLALGQATDGAGLRGASILGDHGIGHAGHQRIHRGDRPLLAVRRPRRRRGVVRYSLTKEWKEDDTALQKDLKARLDAANWAEYASR